MCSVFESNQFIYFSTFLKKTRQTWSAISEYIDGIFLQN
jgi:hypothetical protein